MQRSQCLTKLCGNGSCSIFWGVVCRLHTYKIQETFITAITLHPRNVNHCIHFQFLTCGSSKSIKITDTSWSSDIHHYVSHPRKRDLYIQFILYPTQTKIIYKIASNCKIFHLRQICQSLAIIYLLFYMYKNLHSEYILSLFT